MSKRLQRTRYLLGVVLLLAACTPELVAPSPAPTPQALSVSLDPALLWLEPAVAACAAAQTDLAVLRSDGDPDANLALQLGPPASPREFSAVIGNDELVLAVHPDNPVETLAAAEVERIFSGGIAAWQNVLPDSTAYGSAVEPLVYAAGSALHAAFLDGFLQDSRLGDRLLMLPSPLAMRSEIASRPGAIGVLPARWLDDTVKPVTLTAGEESGTRDLPVVASAEREPQGAARAWLLCLQDILQPENPTKTSD